MGYLGSRCFYNITIKKVVRYHIHYIWATKPLYTLNTFLSFVTIKKYIKIILFIKKRIILRLLFFVLLVRNLYRLQISNMVTEADEKTACDVLYHSHLN